MLSGGRGKRKGPGRPAKGDEVPKAVVTPEMFAKAKTKQPQLRKRLCGSLTEYAKHEASIKYLNSRQDKRGKKCYWCGKYTWSYCGICKDPVTKEPLYLHHCPRTGAAAGEQCFTYAHNDDCFGLAKEDSAFLAEKKCAWSPPSRKRLKEHADHISQLRLEIETNTIVEAEEIE